MSRLFWASKHSVSVGRCCFPLHISDADDAGVDLKKAAKQFANKFATGASVSKNAQGIDEIVVQGDVRDEIQEMIEAGVGVLAGVPSENVVTVNETKKKSKE